jgi:hypothetical protein
MSIHSRRSPLRRLIALLGLAAMASSIGCASTRVATDYDPNAQFAGWKRWAWLPDPVGHAGDQRLHNDLVDARVRFSMRQALTAQGFEEGTVEDADFLVTYYLALDTGIDVRTVHTSFGYSRRGWGHRVATTTRVQQYERGTMLIDVLEPRERRLVWRGSTNSRLSQRSNPAQRQVQIAEAVSSIMERFPPQ